MENRVIREKIDGAANARARERETDQTRIVNGKKRQIHLRQKAADDEKDDGRRMTKICRR